MSIRKVRIAQFWNKYLILVFAAAFAVIGGIIFLFASRAATPITIDNSLPNPTAVGVYGDDRLATVWWTPPADASNRGIVGYYVTYGTGPGQFTHAKQTTYAIIQLQPLTNGQTYNVKVQSVHGTTGTHNGGPEARASGRVSSGVTTQVTPNSTRVDQLRSQMTGFFDDFNTPEGAFDELKWNQATAACAARGSSGAFINNQYHSHNQVASSENPYCDRAQIVSRPRATFDITGRTETNPGVIVADFDGTSVPSRRDVWYIDLVPTNVRTNNIPLDISGHADSGHADPADPAMLRIAQTNGQIKLSYTDESKQHTDFNSNVSRDSPCPHWSQNFTDFWEGGCSAGAANNIPIRGGGDGARARTFPVANVRMQWRVEVSPTKIRVYLNGVKVADGNTPSYFSNIRQYTVHSTLFSYNTGKDSSANQTTSLLHWDNFGFNGPAPTTVVHNYQEGQVDGLRPVLGTGSATSHISFGNSTRELKVNIPDPIAQPREARLMFTINCIANGSWRWDSSQHVVVNGNRYNIPSTASLQRGIVMDNAANFVPYALGIPLNPSHLRQGMNDIKFGLSSCDIINVHIELEYVRGSQPSAYTQPKDIFGVANFLAAVQPTMSTHDSYLFVEQNMDLPSGIIATAPGSNDTTPPTVSITSPMPGTTFVRGTPIDLFIGANDNTAVDKVELFVDGQRNTTITHSPFNHSLSTTDLSVGNHTVYARAFDSSGNTTQSATVTFTLANTRPPVPLPSLEAEDFLYMSPVTSGTDMGASNGSYIRF